MMITGTVWLWMDRMRCGGSGKPCTAFCAFRREVCRMGCNGSQIGSEVVLLLSCPFSFRWVCQNRTRTALDALQTVFRVKMGT